MSDSTAYIAHLAADQSCAITHLCDFLDGRGYRLSDPTNYTEALPVPTADPVAVLTAVWGVGEAHLAIVDADGKRAGWVYLIMPPAVGESESVADYGVNALTEAWAADFDYINSGGDPGEGNAEAEAALRELDNPSRFPESA
jgi:hypothetical protein